MNTSKQAQKDAVEYARAQMFFGEGAGIRRRIIEAKVSDLAQQDPDYAQAFDVALGKQSWSDHAAKAVKERKRLDRGKALKKNSRAVLTGNHRLASSTVVTGFILAGYIAHETGYDRWLLAESKHRYQQAKTWVLHKKQDLKTQRPVSVTNSAN